MVAFPAIYAAGVEGCINWPLGIVYRRLCGVGERVGVLCRNLGMECTQCGQ